MKGCWTFAVDWSALGSMLSGVGTIVGAGTVLIAALIGRNTFKQWRRQKQEERRMAVAEQLLVVAYKLKRAFAAIRSPGMLAGEYASSDATLREAGLITDNLPLGAIDLLRTAQAALTRTKHHDADFEELMNMTPVAKALFGDTVEKAMQELWKQRAVIQIAAQGYAGIARGNAQSEQGIERAIERRSKYEAQLWEGGDENGVDLVADAINGAVATMENALLPIIRNA